MTFLVGSASYMNANATVGDVNVFAGYRHDQIEFTSHVPSSNPIFKESVKFKDINIFQLGANFKTTIGCNFYARAEASFGWILDGEVEKKASLRQQIEGCSSDRFDRILTAEHKNVVDDRYVYDINVAIGYPFYFCDCTTVLAPVIGYAFDSQHVSSHDNFSFGGDDCYSEASCCKHSFLQRWYGPFVGVDFNYRPFNDCWNLFAAFEYHWGTCQLKRSVASSFDSNERFSTSADMDGYVVNLGADYEMCDKWTVGLYLKFTSFEASKHHHWCHNSSSSDYYSSSSDNSDVRGKRKTHWDSYAVNIELGRQF